MMKSDVKAEIWQDLGKRGTEEEPKSPRKGTTNVLSSNVFKDCESIEIPQQLRNIDGARFIRVADGTKIPMDYKWNTERNYPATHAAIKGWTKYGHPYGVVTGIGGLTCLDIDELEIAREIGLIEKLPTTLMIATGGGGQHHWLEANNIEKMTLYHNGVHIGEFQAMRAYVMGPGSTHPNGKKYEIIKDEPIAKITKEELLEIFEKCGITTKKKEQKKHDEYVSNIANRDQDDVDLMKLCKPDHAAREGNEWVGEHPIHGAVHAKDRGRSRNFSVNPSRGVWCCRAHGDSGGGWREWIAVELGIISCEEAGSRKLDKNEYRQIYQEAERRRLIQPREIEDRTSTIQSDICKTSDTTQTTNHIILDKIPDELPEGKLTLLMAKPRSGKTHDAVKKLVNNRQGNYFAPNHDIVKHAMDRAVAMGAKNIVHVEGIQQPSMCRKPKSERNPCDTCQLKPNQHREEDDHGMKHTELEKRAKKLLHEKSTLTKKDVPSDMCPYFTLRYAEKYADYCFTVINNIDNERTTTPRSLVVIDEDTAMDHFYPQSIEIAKITRAHGKMHITSPLEDDVITRKIKEIDGMKKSKLKEYANKIMEIKNIIADLDGSAEKGTDDLISRIDQCLKDWVPPEINIENEEYGKNNEEIRFGDVVKCMMRPCTELRMSTSNTRGSTHVYLLADEKHATMNMGWYEKAEKVLLIGAAKAEMFTNEMSGNIIEIPTFKFRDNFALVVVGLDKGDEEKGKKSKLKAKLIEIAKLVSGGADANTMRPMMVWTGSKDEQHAVSLRIGGGTFRSTTEGEEAQKRIHASGWIEVSYQNSKISRGLDVDQQNLMVAVGTDFAQPYWSAIDQDIARKLTIDETTNSVLRISPTDKSGAERGKMILIPEGEEWKVPCLQERIIKTDASAKGIARMIINMGIAGESNIDEDETIKMVRRGITMDGLYEKVHAKLMIADDYVDDDIVESAEAMTLNLLKENKKKWFKTHDIKVTLKHNIKTIKCAVDNIVYEKKAQCKMTGTTLYLRHLSGK